MTRERWMALLFALGSTCFLIGPFPGYAQLVGATADAVTFFLGSILFTAGGALQSLIAFPERHSNGAGRAAWLAATIQSAGTLFFNVTTYQALHTSLSDSHYDRLVWRPDAFGSICFLVSGTIAYRASPRHGWLPARGSPGLVGTVDQPARLHLLRDFGDRWLPGSLDRLAAQPGVGELEHRARSRVLPGLRASDAADRPHAQVAAVAAPAPARGPRQARLRADRVTRLRTQGGGSELVAAGKLGCQAATRPPPCQADADRRGRSQAAGATQGSPAGASKCTTPNAKRSRRQ